MPMQIPVCWAPACASSPAAPGEPLPPETALEVPREGDLLGVVQGVERRGNAGGEDRDREHREEEVARLLRGAVGRIAKVGDRAVVLPGNLHSPQC